MSGQRLWLFETNVKIKKDVGIETMPKTIDTRRHCEVGVRVCNHLPQLPLYIGVCRRLFHTRTPSSQGLLVSTSKSKFFEFKKGEYRDHQHA